MSVDLKNIYPKLVNLLLDPVFVVDATGAIVFVTDACEELLGYTASEMIGTPVLSYVHPDDRDRTLAAARNVMDGRPHLDFENRYLCKDGRAVHILWSARWSPEDRVRIAVARDVTALRQADQTRDVLYRIALAAHTSESIQALYECIQRELAALYPGRCLYLTRYDAVEETLSSPPAPATSGALRIDDGPLQNGTAIAELIRSGQPLLASRDLSSPGLGTMGVGQGGDSSWLGVPLVTQDRVLGAVVFESRSSEERLSVEDRELLEFVATQVATAIERGQAEKRLRFMAHHDPLTGLTNRSLFYDRLETALRSARRNDKRLALLYLDLDDFKQVNDSLGHVMGDRMLREVASRLEQCCRESDTVARMGGDEFTVVLTEVHESRHVDSKVRQIREAIALPMELDGARFSVSCSIGVAIYPDHGDSAEQLLHQADAGMYGMKRS